MQQKLTEILDKATGWMTAAEIADKGGWRSPANVGVALQQMEKADGRVERRKSDTKKQGNGMPGTHFKPGQETVLIPVDRRGETVIPCPNRVEPTDEQVKQYREESERHWLKTVAALKVATAWKVRPKPDHDREEIVDCPICKGKLHLRQSSYNGHASAKCETADCVEFME